MMPIFDMSLYKVLFAVGWVMQGGMGVGGVGWVNSIHRVGWSGVQKISLNNFYHKLGTLSFLLTNHCQLFSG